MRVRVECADCGAWYVGPFQPAIQGFCRRHLRVTITDPGAVEDGEQGCQHATVGDAVACLCVDHHVGEE